MAKIMSDPAAEASTGADVARPDEPAFEETGVKRVLASDRVFQRTEAQFGQSLPCVGPLGRVAVAARAPPKQLGLERRLAQAGHGVQAAQGARVARARQ